MLWFAPFRGAVAQFGRAPESHSGGRRFDPVQLHHPPSPCQALLRLTTLRRDFRCEGSNHCSARSIASGAKRREAIPFSSTIRRFRGPRLRASAYAPTSRTSSASVARALACAAIDALSATRWPLRSCAWRRALDILAETFRDVSSAARLPGSTASEPDGMSTAAARDDSARPPRIESNASGRLISP